MLKQIIIRMGYVLSLALIAALLPASAAALPVAGAQQAGQADWVAKTETVSRSGEVLQQEVEPVETRLYPLQHVDLDSAHQLASVLCRESQARYGSRVDCNVSVMGREDTLVVIATAAIHERIASLLADVDKPPYTQSFHIIVLAATESASTPSDLPPDAQRALEDIKAFLPYEGFRVLDTGWLKTVREGQTTLTGPTGFNVELVFRGDPGSNEQLLVQEFSMGAFVPHEREDGSASSRYQQILHTSFSMNVGETVVVGTSKLNGGEEPTALVILLTALDPEGSR